MQKDFEKTEREDRPRVASVILEHRKQLHKEIVKKMMQLKLCTSPEIIEAFKRRYLFDFHNVETSRALDLQGLKNAVEMLEKVTSDFMIKSILMHYKKFSSDRDLLRCTHGQVGKIQAVGIYKIGLKPEALTDYASTSLERPVTLYDMSVEEAHRVIKRLEEWEAKVLMSKKKKDEAKR